MTIEEKAERAEKALRQLRMEAYDKADNKVFNAIDDYVNTASRESLARLFDIVKAS